MIRILLTLLVCLAVVSCSRDSGNGEVRDPGAAGKRTIEGIDRDGDGVRDDLQVWIDSTFTEDERVRMAVREMAKSHPSDCEFKNKVRCLESIVGFEKSFEIEIELMERYLNTEARQKDFEERLEPCPLLEDMASAKCHFLDDEKQEI